MSDRRSRKSNRGAALITVLWLTTALAVIGFSVARTVREETQRTENLVDGSRATLLAKGAIERVIYFFLFPRYEIPGQPPPPLATGQQRAYLPMPGGDVVVEILPESGKLGVNSAKPEQLLSLFLAMGIPAQRAQGIAAAIVNWRTPNPQNFQLASTFWIRHASFEQIEELLLVPGITPDLYYGYMERLPGGETVRRPGLRDVLSVYGSDTNLHINSAHPAAMMTIGLSPGDAGFIVSRRQIAPFSMRELTDMVLSNGPANRFLHAGNDSAYTVKATARPRRPDGGLSDYKRTVAALVVFNPVVAGQPVRPSIRQWYEISSTDLPWPVGGRQ